MRRKLGSYTGAGLSVWGCGLGSGIDALEISGIGWGNPGPAMGTTRYYCRYIKALLTPYEGAITIGGIDPRFRV